MPTDSRALITHIRELIATPSISSVSPKWDTPNTVLITGLAERLETAGWQVDIQNIPDTPGKQNLIATLGKEAEEGQGTGLVLSGHTDTVPCDDALWASDPFSLAERDQRLYGLGSADMKAFLAIAMSACADIDPAKLTAPVILLATADEESSMAGARALAASGKPAARYAVIGEPTGLQPIRMHKGIFMESITVTGQSGHSSDPDVGHNALVGMQVVINELQKWQGELRAGPLNDAFKVPYSTLNLGHIHGGDNPNRICGECELQIDLRFIPGLNRDELRTELNQRLRRSLIRHYPDMDLTCKSLFDGTQPMLTDKESALVKTAEAMTGKRAGAVSYATEAPYLSSLGMDVVVLGPGSIDQAHQPNEFLPLDQIQPTIEIIRKLIKKFCMA
ncbi:MAG: acetylornithine deacetylase [Gammaproteobacteria bacterium]|nr:acetylornithine deacetylase [Gammaproteobacteria bacterium]MCP4090475.1 acetylornithine deacetylase [Gammaproteobacteria bacterium]MCP4276660.1 acetylornithine deacetylase [Gammaproteobacteria bacterium]MCP4831410.1 acetylornithine deacetylase [Gammaproteobacteria bacterium]MCP4927954.1 acetylornithine deacetylase [Gammaproteobacteria bacterium]